MSVNTEKLSGYPFLYNFELHPPVALAIIFLSLEHTNDVVLLNETFRWLGCQLAFVVWHCSFHCFSPKVPCRHAVRFLCVKKCCQLCLVIQEFWFFIVPLPRGCQVVGVLRRKKPGMQGGNSRSKGEDPNPGDLLHTWDSTTQLHGDFYKLLQWSV